MLRLALRCRREESFLAKRGRGRGSLGSAAAAPPALMAPLASNADGNSSSSGLVAGAHMQPRSTLDQPRKVSQVSFCLCDTRTQARGKHRMLARRAASLVVQKHARLLTMAAASEAKRPRTDRQGFMQELYATIDSTPVTGTPPAVRAWQRQRAVARRGNCSTPAACQPHLVHLQPSPAALRTRSTCAHTTEASTATRHWVWAC